MKQYVYKIIIFILAIIFIYEFTIGKQINKYADQLNSINSKDGRKETVEKIKNELRKGVEKDRYLSKEDAKLSQKLISL